MHKITSGTLQQMLQQSSERYAELNCLSFVDGSPITFFEFNRQVHQVQHELRALGIAPHDKVAILSQSMPQWGIAYFAITTMGAVAVPLLPDFSATEVENILNHSDSKAIFASRRQMDKLEGIKINGIQHKICLEDFFTYETSVTGSSNTSVQSECYTVLPEDLAAIIYTSGTTGKSKGVMLTHGNLMSQLEMIINLEYIKTGDTFLSVLPLSHAYENSLGLLTPIMQGATVYYLEKPPTVSVLMPALKKIRPTYMLSVPMIMEKIYRGKILPQFQANAITRALYKIPFARKLMHKKAAKTLFEAFGGRLRLFAIGGSKIDPIVERFLYEGKYFPYGIGYGLTETAPLLAGANHSMVKWQSTGPAMVGLELKINDPNPLTGEGEVWAKGPNIMQGYYKEEAMTREVLTTDGWFKTGDLGVFDEKNRLYIKGRLKNMILGASGENIYPEEIESVINNFKYVQDSLVVEQKGKLVAMVRFNPEDLEKRYQNFKQDMEELKRNVEHYIAVLKEELLEYVNARVNRFSRISMVVVQTNDFEKTSTSKIKRYLYS